MLCESKRAAILELRQQGNRIRQIARTLGASRTTVRSVIESGTAQVPRPNKAEPCRAQILVQRFRGSNHNHAALSPISRPWFEKTCATTINLAAAELPLLPAMATMVGGARWVAFRFGLLCGRFHVGRALSIAENICLAEVARVAYAVAACPVIDEANCSFVGA